MSRIARDDLSDGQPPEPEARKVVRKGTFPASGKGAVFSKRDGLAISGRLRVELSYDETHTPVGATLHLAAFLIDSDSKVPGGNPFFSVHHDNDRSKDGSALRLGRVKHGHRVRNETITITTDRVSKRVTEIVLVAYIQDASELNHTFSKVQDGLVTFYQLAPYSGLEEDEDDDILDEDAKEIHEHRLDGDYDDGETAVIVGHLIRQRDHHDWIYRDVSDGRPSISEVGEPYGVLFV